MKARHLLPALALLATAACTSEPEVPHPKNVLLLVVDTLRADRLGCYGYGRETSPNIDSLAASGTLYENCYSQACWTVPSMISMMSGVFVTQRETALPDGLIVLAEALHSRGLETAAFPANPTLCLDRGFERGYDHFIPIEKGAAPALSKKFAEWYQGKRADEERRDKPFFAWAQFIDPHQPYTPKAKHDIFRGALPEQGELSKRWRAEQHRVEGLSPDLESLSFADAAAKMNRESNLYDGEVHQADAGIGQILDLLRDSGELEDTLVIIASDHGEMLFEHPREPRLVQSCIEKEGGLPDGVKDLFGNGHRPWYYDNLWNTPLILSGPGIEAGVRRNGLAANLDLFPTILEALDLAPIPGLDGQSLFTGREAERERIFAYGHLTPAVREASGKKLFVHPRLLYMLEGEGPRPTKLYDLPTDPSELSELSATSPEEVQRLQGLVDAWKAENKRDARTTTSAAQRKVLKDLGYIGTGLDFNADDE